MSMEGGSLVFNSGYKSIAAEWLGLSGEKSSVDRNEVESEGEDESEQVSKSKQENLKKKSNKTQHDSQKHKNVKRKEEKVKLSIEVGQKLGKKLTKAKKRSHERANVEKDNRGFKADSSDDDEKSKVDLVKKPRLESANNKTTSTPLTVKDVTKRLKDATLSKPARKRLKKKLKQLQEKDKESMNLNETNKKVNSTKPQPTKEEAKLKRKEIDEFSKNFLSGMQNSNNMKKDKSKFTNVMKKERNLDNADKSVFSVDRAGDNHLKDTKTNPPSKKKTKKKKSAFSESNNSTMSPKPLKKKTLNGKISKVSSEEGAKEETESDNTLKKKRKRHKRRSKQKNINRDHRADSEKPSHLQGAGIKRVKKTTSGDDSDS